MRFSSETQTPAAPAATKPRVLSIADRNGFILGEGGFLLSGRVRLRGRPGRGARVYGEIVGVGATASKTRLNGWPADHAGLAAAMRLALSDAGLRARRDRGRDRHCERTSPVLDRLESRRDCRGVRQPLDPRGLGQGRHRRVWCVRAPRPSSRRFSRSPAAPWCRRPASSSPTRRSRCASAVVPQAGARLGVPCQ